jgi:hypothetical protein
VTGVSSDDAPAASLGTATAHGHQERPTGLIPADTTAVPAAERVILAVLALLRAVTLVLGGLELPRAVRPHDLPAASLLLAALVCVSAVTFGRAARRLGASRPEPPLDAITAWTETLTGVAALLLLAHLTAASSRAGSGFWAEPYTVVSAVIIGAAARRFWAGALGAACLAAGYLLAVITAIAGPVPHAQAYTAPAWTNASSYLAFYAVAAMGFRLLRNIAGQAEALRLMIARLSAERTHYADAERIWRIGHDNPKALLREVRRPVLPAGKLRELAPVFREELISELAADPGAPGILAEELTRIAATFARLMPLEVDLTAMSGQPPGIPALLMAEATRELLNNASYHRYGYQAWLTASSSAEHAQIQVHNDGPGVDPQRLASAWARKKNSLHQFETAGGAYRIDSSPAWAGTTVVLRYPSGDANVAVAS